MSKTDAEIRTAADTAAGQCADDPPQGGGPRKLPARQREAVLLFYSHDFKQNELAALPEPLQQSLYGTFQLQVRDHRSGYEELIPSFSSFRVPHRDQS